MKRLKVKELNLGEVSLLALVTSVLLLVSATAQVTVLRGATVIDGTGAAPQSDITVVIENGRLRDIGRDVARPAGATVIDATGKFVVPGIINAHGHVGP